MTVNANAVVKIKDIPGALLAKHISDACDCEDGEGCRAFKEDPEDYGWDRAITAQGNVGITLNRERLARVMFYIHIGRIDPKRWEIESTLFKDYRRMEADAILADLQGLIEVAE